MLQTTQQHFRLKQLNVLNGCIVYLLFVKHIQVRKTFINWKCNTPFGKYFL